MFGDTVKRNPASIIAGNIRDTLNIHNNDGEMRLSGAIQFQEKRSRNDSFAPR